MPRALMIVWIAGVLALASCGPAPAPESVLPTFVEAPSPELDAVPEPNEAYPTAQAAEPSSSQSVSGFSVDLRKVWRDGKQVNAEVCFSLPDASDWTIWAAHYEFGGTVVSEFSSEFLSKSEPTDGQAAQRCDQVSFYVPPDADLSSSSLTVESVGAYPAAEEYCSLYMPKIQQALVDRGIAITLDCPVVDGVGSPQIVSKPPEMSQVEAEQLAFSEEFYTVRGPWIFPVTFGQ